VVWEDGGRKAPSYPISHCRPRGSYFFPLASPAIVETSFAGSTGLVR
jgi:hypothetical protein